MSRLEELNKFDDRELLARVLQAEAGNQGLTGKLAVGAVIRNRAEESGYGDSIRGVITKPGQFSPVNYYTGYAGGEQGVDFESKAAQPMTLRPVMTRSLSSTGLAMPLRTWISPVWAKPLSSRIFEVCRCGLTRAARTQVRGP